jgi:predicted Zn-dependent protease
MRSTLLCLAALSCCACGTTQLANLETAAVKTFISDDQENQIGLQVKQEVEQKQHVQYLQDPTVTAYVGQVAERVLAFARQERPGLTWKVQVIDDPKTVNAFATPGGYLYVYSGLVLAADNEAQLAGVLGHESGHVVARHSARSMVDAYGLEAVAQLALGQNPGLLATLGTQVAEKGVMLAHSRGEEDEADEYGARYASRAGYDPHALAAFFQKLRAAEGNSPALLAWLSDHPATNDRIAHVNRYITEHQLGGSDLGADRLTPIKARLRRRAGRHHPAKVSFDCVESTGSRPPGRGSGGAARQGLSRDSRGT